MESVGEITRLLSEWQQGDRNAYHRLMPMVYDELRMIAHRLESQMRASTLQPTAVVHELYLKLGESGGRRFENRLHFYSLAARAMRQILIDRGRRLGAEKRGGKAGVLPLDEATMMAPENADTVMDLHLALSELEAFDSRKGKMVELRYFAGLKMEEIAELEGVSPETVRREMRLAEAWLLSYLRRSGS